MGSACSTCCVECLTDVCGGCCFNPIYEKKIIHENEEKNIVSISNQPQKYPINDFFDWFHSLFFSFLSTKDLSFIVYEYYGCYVCQDPPHRNYLTKMIPSNIKIVCNTKKTCKYCGLSFRHHTGNHEYVSNRFSILTETKQPFDPQDYYCDIRCPFDQCSKCGSTFVKIRENHFCTQCYVEWRKLPLFRQIWRPIHMNRYADEMVVRGIYHIIPMHRGSHIEERTGKHGKVIRDVVYFNYVKYGEVVAFVLQWLIDQKIERICSFCHNRFSCSISNENRCGFCF